ncbi:MAG: nucleoside recognition domain-containing protein [Flavonifractor plautii]
MGRLLGKQHIRDLCLALGLLCAALALVLWPGEAMSAMKDGLSLCGNVILPSLFPFFVLSSLVVELGMSRCLGRLFQPVMAPLFRVNGACASAVALGFIGGYPVGARTAIALYESGQCSRTEAERLLAFCNNSGPAFILGVVGTGVFGTGGGPALSGPCGRLPAGGGAVPLLLPGPPPPQPPAGGP